jgi:DNA-binding HxlR family transcriptional regulator
MTQKDANGMPPFHGSEPRAATSPIVVPDPSPTDLDPVLHDRMRLGIVSVLALNERVPFMELRTALGMTDGNLSLHIRRLEEAGYIVGQKTIQTRVPRTEYRLTPAGRKAFENYLGQLESLIGAARRGRQA